MEQWRKLAEGERIFLPVAAADPSSLSLFDALARRKTTREIAARPLSLQMLANLLWAGDGVNRAKNGPFGLTGRTAASASNSQEIEIYVVLDQGAYRYEALENALVCVAPDDLRNLTLTPGQRGIDANAPAALVYVVDIDRLVHSKGYQEPGLHDAEIQKSYYFVDTSLIAGNVYLFAAANGLAAWFHNCDRAGLAGRLSLKPSQRVLFAQSVGYPAKPQKERAHAAVR